MTKRAERARLSDLDVPRASPPASHSSDVLAAYEQKAQDFESADPRDQPTYLISKLRADYALIERVGADRKRVLNVGCSFPVDELHYARKIGQWVCVDLSPESLRGAQRILSAELSPELAAKFSFECADACFLPFPDGTFDLSVSMSTFDHLPTAWARQKAVDEMARTTKPGGHVIVTVANRWCLPYAAGIRKMSREGTLHYGYAYLFSPRELKQMGERAGLRALHFASSIRTPDVWLPGYPFFVRYPALAAFEVVRRAGYFGRRVGYAFEKRA